VAANSNKLACVLIREEGEKEKKKRGKRRLARPQKWAARRRRKGQGPVRKILMGQGKTRESGQIQMTNLFFLFSFPGLRLLKKMI
jgi:hypothetical protein